MQKRSQPGAKEGKAWVLEIPRKLTTKNQNRIKAGGGEAADRKLPRSHTNAPAHTELPEHQGPILSLRPHLFFSSRRTSTPAVMGHPIVSHNWRPQDGAEVHRRHKTINKWWNMRERSGSREPLLVNPLDPDYSIEKQIKCKILILNGVQAKFIQLEGLLEGLRSLKGRKWVRKCSAGGGSQKEGGWDNLINQVGSSKSMCKRMIFMVQMVWLL